MRFGVAVGFGGDGTSAGAGIRRFLRRTRRRERGGLLSSGGALDQGDSGGPLFSVTLALGVETLRVFGVDSTEENWAEPSLPRKQDWIRSVTDRNGDGRADTACSNGPRGADPLATLANDQGGDAYVDSEDSCPTPYNPCQLETDSDGDGAPDDCDACPSDGTVSSLRGALDNRDGDRLPAGACEARGAVVPAGARRVLGAGQP